jgi:hypothetical protein
MFMHWMVVGCDVNGGDAAAVLFQSEKVDGGACMECAEWITEHRQEFLLKPNMRLLLCASLARFEKPKGAQQ